MNKIFYYGTLLFSLSSAALFAQKTEHYNLTQLLKDGKLTGSGPVNAAAITDGKYKGISCKPGVYWIKGSNFSNGTIEIDVKGRDVVAQSFLGVALHIADTAHYDVIYLRPFNFQTTDTVRRTHAIQYVSAPDYSWEKLRGEHPLQYEQPITPSTLSPNDWVHMSIVVKDGEITVYLDHSPVAALKVTKLSTINNGFVGLFAFGEAEADFANLSVTAGKG